MLDLVLFIIFIALTAVFVEVVIREFMKARIRVMREQADIHRVLKEHTQTMIKNHELKKELDKIEDERDDLRRQASKLENKVGDLEAKLTKAETMITWEFMATNYRVGIRGQSSKTDTVMALNEIDAKYLAQRRYPSTQGWEVSNFKHKRRG